MKKIIILGFVIFFTLPAFSWGPTGHRVTGFIANRYLNKKTRIAIERILNGQSLAIASTWMDEVRADTNYNKMTDWHWVTIQEGSTYERAEKNSNGDIIQTIERIVTELKTKKLSPTQEAEYLKILIHLVGDIHQPLHVGGGSDRGGNEVKVMWFREDSNLHRVWDSDMIDHSRLSYTELAESLDKPTPQQLALWRNSSVRDWAMESVSFRKQVYAFEGTRLGYEYTYKNFNLVRQRLLQAGIRLAHILNQIYGS